ncbi:MAG: sodium:alanine symporter family protein [Ruminococcus sp.]|nr:sodium:alanine symporter family protein [Ruminococcus sp.]
MAEKINTIVWGTPTVCLLLLTGIVYTVRLGLIQFRMFPYIFKRLRRGGNIRPQLKTSCLSLGAAMGTGNITGVASALAIGGAGAVFWMWISAFLGMATVFAENSLSAVYSEKNIKGPMAYLEKGLGSKVLAVVFAVCCVLASFGMGGMVQISSMSNSIKSCCGISPFMLASILFAAVFFTVRGGASRVGSAAQVLLPAVSVIYAALCIMVICRNHERLPEAFSDIFSSAIGVRQTVGGAAGYGISAAVSAGVRRGIFSNEAGLGSSPLLHSTAENNNSAQIQGMSSMLEVFTDTMLCCTLTALTLLCSGADTGISHAFLSVTGSFTEPLIAVILSVFAFCTVIGWYCCGETAFIYLSKGGYTEVFAFIYALTAASGAVFKAELLWTLSDIFNGLMMLPNIIGLLFLAKKVKHE